MARCASNWSVRVAALPRRLPADVHAVVRLRRRGPDPGGRRRATARRCSAAAAVYLDNSSLPRQRAAHRRDRDSCGCGRCEFARGSAGSRSPGCASKASIRGCSSERSRRGRYRPQPPRRRDRHVQASEDAVMEEPRFDPLDYVSAFNRRKWWFIVPVALVARHRRAAGLAAAPHAISRRRRSRSARRASRPTWSAARTDRPGRAHARRLAAAAAAGRCSSARRASKQLDRTRIDRRRREPLQSRPVGELLVVGHQGRP